MVYRHKPLEARLRVGVGSARRVVLTDGVLGLRDDA